MKHRYNMGLFGNLFGIKSVERDRSGNFYYEINVDGFQNSEKYLEMSLTNPVLMTLIALRAKIYSQMRIVHQTLDGKVIENSPYVKLLANPNYFQSQQDYFFQQMWFLSACGNCYTYEQKARTSNFEANTPSAIYNLIPSDIDFRKVDKVNKFIATKQDRKAFGERYIIYKLDDEKHNIYLKDIIPFYDLANGLTSNSFMSSPSRVKGIAKVLENIDENIKSKNINLKMSQKYIARNKSNMQGSPVQLQKDDRTVIERILWSKNIQITNNDVEIQHLVSDFKKLFLDDMFKDDALKCLLAFDMNKDILNYYGANSTFENQEKGELRYLQNSIMTTASNTMNSFSQQWNLYEKGEQLVASYDHLTAMQPVINEKIDTLMKFQETMKIAIENETISKEDAKKKTDALILKLQL